MKKSVNTLAILRAIWYNILCVSERTRHYRKIIQIKRHNIMDMTDNETKTAAVTGNAASAEKDFKGGLINEVLDWIESFAFASFIVLLVFIFLFRTVVVDGASMNPTLYNSQRLVLTHFRYVPEQGDIIVANSPGLNKTIIKRCIGVAGDKVKVDYGTHTVTVNGTKLDEPYLDASDPMTLKPYFDETYRVSDMVYEYTVPEGTVFAMGDNRNGSNDSRSSDVGFIKKEDILGRAFFRFYIGKDDSGNKNPGKIGSLK